VAAPGTVSELAREFVRYPPWRPHVLLPRGNRRGARHGVALATASSTAARFAQRGALLAVGVGGTALLPGARVVWDPPMGAHEIAAIVDAWRDAGLRFDAWSVYERPQAARAGFGVLLSGADPAFVKLEPSTGARLVREARALRALARGRPAVFRVPLVRAEGEHAGWRWLATSCLPAGLHRPALTAPVEQVADDIARCLGGTFAGDDVRAGWVPMHGDLTPWNLRRVRRGTWLIDWEHAGFGPAGADVAYFRATRALLRRTPPGRASGEVVDFWLERVTRRAADPDDASTNRRLLRLLEEMRASDP
jgi:hypothetical protein